MAECPKLSKTKPPPASCGNIIHSNQPFKTLFFAPDNPEEMNNKTGIVKGTATTPEGLPVGRAEYDINIKVLTVDTYIKTIDLDD